ncbi:MAG TPA: CoA transferase [Dehalococcoidia bacterium]|nr:CoA transferase [Dehalococcoidia bacterium]
MPLDGVRVIDLTAVWAGPFGTRLLGDYGAEVIKVESPRQWDLLRSLGRIPRSETRWFNQAAYFNHNNRSKYGFALDLSGDVGRDLLLKLAGKSDVIIENFRSEVMGNLRLMFEDLRKANPEIIYVSMPGHGKTGPEKDFVSFGSNVEQLSGLVSVSGYPGGEPTKTGISYGDPVAGIALVAAVALALRKRTRTGEGSYVELAQREVLMSFVGEYLVDYSLNEELRELAGNAHPSHAPHGCYRSAGADAWITIVCETDGQFAALCKVIEAPELIDDARFATPTARKTNEDALSPYIEAWTLERGHYEAMYHLQRAGVPAGAVLTIPELMADPQLRYRRAWVEHTHPDAGTWEVEAPPWSLPRTPGHVRFPAPGFGQHNRYVLEELLQLSEREIVNLYAQGVVADEPDQTIHM